MSFTLRLRNGNRHDGTLDETRRQTGVEVGVKSKWNTIRIPGRTTRTLYSSKKV